MGQFFSVCGQICGQGVPGRTKQAEIVTRMAGLKQIMEIFKAINQPLSSEQRVRWYRQRVSLGPVHHESIPGFFIQSRFRSSFSFWVIDARSAASAVAFSCSRAASRSAAACFPQALNAASLMLPFMYRA